MKGILLSGGMDSIALAYMCKPDIAFNINYGQASAEAEYRAAKAVCEALSIELVHINIDCSELGSGDLTNSEPITLAPQTDWWPYRNQLLITLCGMKAIEYECTNIIIGTVKTDQYHSDGSLEFIQNISRLMAAQEGNISIEVPAINMNTVELIKTSMIPFELLAWSHSCHKANLPCANCRGCNKYYTTLYELGYFNG